MWILAALDSYKIQASWFDDKVKQCLLPYNFSIAWSDTDGNRMQFSHL